MDRFVADITFALRSLRKSPAFTITALLTLALGIGASTAIFSVVNAVLLRELPYRDPSRLVLVWTDLEKRNLRDFPVATGDIPDIREQITQLKDYSGIVTFKQTVTGDNFAPEQIRTAGVMPNFFTMLGAPVAFGRTFADEDGTPNPAPPPGAANGPPVANAPPPPRLPAHVILSHEFWVRRFGGDSSVVGRTIDIGGGHSQVVGVLKPGFEVLFPPGTNIERRPDVYQALRIDFANASRLNVNVRVLARLADGATLATAQRQADATSRDLRKRFPIKETSGMHIRLESMHADLVADVRPAILALMGGVTFVLLIACANVANLLLVRASLRAREFAVRTALGASRGVLLRQLLSESLVLGAAGAVLGLFVAQGGIALLAATAPANVPLVDEVAVDPMVLGFALVACLASALIFGVVPALRASQPDLSDSLKAGGRNEGLAGGGRRRDLVVMAEVALCFVLLVGSGLMTRTFMALQRVDPGFDASGLLTFQMNLPPLRTPEEAQAFERRVRETFSALPGVTAVTAATPLPLDAQVSNLRWGTESAAADPSQFQQANAFFVLPGYFATMRTRLIAGRTFTDADNRPDALYLVIDDLLAKRAFGNASPIGKRLLVRVRTNEPETWEVIGVVAHQRHDGLATPGREELFMAEGIIGFGVNGYALRTTGDPNALVAAVRASLPGLDSRLAISDVQPMQQLVDQAMGPTRFALVLIACFAAIAAVLAAVGLYGVLTTVVRQRTAEIGVRMALGAQPLAIVHLVMRQGLRLSAIGMAAGLVGALALTQAMTKMLVGVTPTDPVTFATMVLFFATIAAVASYLPARRAAALDPNVALRKE